MVRVVALVVVLVVVLVDGEVVEVEEDDETVPVVDVVVARVDASESQRRLNCPPPSAEKPAGHESTQIPSSRYLNALQA